MKNRIRIALLIAGNLFSAVGAGIVFVQGIDLISHLHFVKFDSILAYLVAVLLQLFIVLRARRSSAASFWLYTGAAFVLCLGLIPLWSQVGVGFAGEMALFVVMTAFFAFSFVPRFLRADYAAQAFEKLNYVELSYWVGYLLVIAAWPKNAHWATTAAPLVASGLLFIAVLCDLLTKMALAAREAKPAAPAASFALLKEPAFRAGVIVFGLLTLGVQIVAKRATSLSASTGPLFSFYAGVLLASIFCAFRAFPMVNRRAGVLGDTTEVLPGRQTSVALLVLLTFGASFAAVASFATGFTVLSLAFFGLAAFAYEVASMVLLSDIGRRWGAVSLAFSLGGVLAAVSYAGLLYSGVGFGAVLSVVAVTGGAAFALDRSWA